MTGFDALKRSHRLMNALLTISTSRLSHLADVCASLKYLIRP
jgi:hypothetical protein